MPVVSGPPATALVAALDGPSSTTAAWSGPTSSGWARNPAADGCTTGTYPAPSVASFGSDSPRGRRESLASSHGADAADCSNSSSAGPPAGTVAPPTVAVACPRPAAPVGVWVTSAAKKRGKPDRSGR
jgi:hypothetical protein